MTDWLRWALLPAASVHIFEEFVFPGGFPAWYRTYRAAPTRITPRFLVIVNLARQKCEPQLLGAGFFKKGRQLKLRPDR